MPNRVYFTVPADKEPTEEQARVAANANFSKWTQCYPNSFPEKNRAAYIEEEWQEHLIHLRAKVGEPLQTVNYDQLLPDYGDLMTVQEFRANVECGAFIDYDGDGKPVKDGKAAPISIRPSLQHLIPLDATHILWFNR